MKQPITLILLGDIAAGKGTQAKILAKKFRLQLIGTGTFTRKFWTGQSKVGRRLEKTKLGKLTPSDIIKKFLKNTLTKISKSRGILLDGGKMPSEAQLIYKIFARQARKILVIYLNIPKTEIYRRLKWRYYCERTGRPLIIKSRTQICPHCGGRIIKRADDDPAAIKNRIEYYDKIYQKTVRFWQSKKVLARISSKKPIPAVTREIVKIIKNYYAAS